MNSINIADSIWNKATEFMHQSGTRMESAHIEKKTTYISGNYQQSPEVHVHVSV